jgi:small-conductance mechanosensitive channel
MMEDLRPRLDSLEQAASEPLVARLLTALIVLFVIWMIARAIRRQIGRHVEDRQLRHRGRKAVGTVGWIVGLLVCLAIFSDRLGGLAVSLGLAGAGIAFALQEVIASFAGRVAILFGNFYKAGDRVQLGGIKGDVIDIGLLRTTIMEVGDWVKGDLFSGRVVRVANSFIFKEPVFNYSADFSFLWDEITVPIKYGCDPALAKRTLEEVVERVTGEYSAHAEKEWQAMLRKYNVERARVQPMVTLVANDNWMQYTIRYVVPYTKRRITQDELFTQILAAIDASDGKLVLASATVELVGAPPLVIDNTGEGGTKRVP